MSAHTTLTNSPPIQKNPQPPDSRDYSRGDTSSNHGRDYSSDRDYRRRNYSKNRSRDRGNRQRSYSRDRNRRIPTVSIVKDSFRFVFKLTLKFLLCNISIKYHCILYLIWHLFST